MLTFRTTFQRKERKEREKGETEMRAEQIRPLKNLD
jgi:hypothetical protein